MGRLVFKWFLVLAVVVFMYCMYWWHESVDEPMLEVKTHQVYQSVRVDAATDDRRAVAARTDGSPRAASDQDRAMTRLMNRGDLSKDYGELMRRLHADGANDEKSRNFAIQHLGFYARERRRRGAYDPHTREAEEIRAALEAAAQETSTTVAAPALRALADLAAFDAEVDAEGLDRRLVACLADPAVSLPARVMAAQLCGERRLAVARPLLERLGRGETTPTPLALAARRAIRLIDGM